MEGHTFTLLVQIFGPAVIAAIPAVFMAKRLFEQELNKDIVQIKSNLEREAAIYLVEIQSQLEDKIAGNSAVRAERLSAIKDWMFAKASLRAEALGFFSDFYFLSLDIRWSRLDRLDKIMGQFFERSEIVCLFFGEVISDNINTMANSFVGFRQHLGSWAAVADSELADIDDRSNTLKAFLNGLGEIEKCLDVEFKKILEIE